MEPRKMSTKQKQIMWVVGLCMAIMATACSNSQAAREKNLKQQADSFATYYYNWQFHKAQTFTTEESEPWLRMAASQLTQKDVDLLNETDENATCEVGDIDYENDSTARVQITVRHYLRIDSIGVKATPTDRGTFVLPMVYQNGKKQWYVNLNGVLREENQQSE